MKHILPKIHRLYTKQKKILLYGLYSFIFVVLFSLFFVPYVSYSVGNIFFGNVRQLYNISFAHFLFARSVSSPFFKPVPYAHYQLGRTYFIQGDLEKALVEEEAELALYPEDTKTYYVLGLIYGYMGKTTKAIDSFSTYIETHPLTWAGRNDKAWLQFRVGDVDGAIATIEPFIKNFKYTPWVQNTYCALLISKKEYKKAQEPCTNAKTLIDKMTVEGWGHAYPGNDPRVYATGLQAMKDSINLNMSLLEKAKK